MLREGKVQDERDLQGSTNRIGPDEDDGGFSMTKYKCRNCELDCEYEQTGEGRQEPHFCPVEGREIMWAEVLEPKKV